MKYFLLCLAQAAAISLAAPASASPFYPTEAAVFFSPNGGAENAIVQSIDSAKVRIRMQAFLFSNKEITQALIRAHQRGVKVDVIIDKKMPKKKPNTTEDLLKTGVPTFFDTAHRTAHDKIIIVDDNIVLTGSFNFVKVAETKNGENLLILIFCERHFGAFLFFWRCQNGVREMLLPVFDIFFGERLGFQN